MTSRAYKGACAVLSVCMAVVSWSMKIGSERSYRGARTNDGEELQVTGSLPIAMTRQSREPQSSPFEASRVRFEIRALRGVEEKTRTDDGEEVTRSRPSAVICRSWEPHSSPFEASRVKFESRASRGVKEERGQTTAKRRQIHYQSR